MKLAAFDFHLPDELIAQQAVPRGDSRLLLLGRTSGAVAHASVRALPSLLRAGDLLVANDTRVFPARLLGHRVPTGGAVECLLLARDRTEHRALSTEHRAPSTEHRALSTEHRAPSTEHRALSTEHRALSTEHRAPSTEHRALSTEHRAPSTEHRALSTEHRAPSTEHPAPSTDEIWTALVHPGQKLKPGALVKFESDAGILMAEILERQFFGRRTIRLWAEGGANVDDLVDAMGHIPLPPYIQRADTSEDRARYQTVFASARGSIAAPTAGLHFDEALVTAIEAAGVERVTITLHVGYGTFKPVRVDEVEAHVVDPEPYEISPAAAAAINGALDQGRRVVAVGTTTTRALEDAARRGSGRVRPGRADAELFIYPEFDFQVISGLMTNFHLPKSSLLMLVAAFAGREHVLHAYAQAVAGRYRFYSYGDAMLII